MFAVVAVKPSPLQPHRATGRLVLYASSMPDNDLMTDQDSVDGVHSDPTSEAAGRPEPHGLFDGFEGYRTPSEDDYRRVLTEGLVVPDTNVLLNLYRYNAQTQTDLFAVLERLGDRLWIPHQVLVEFWRNRESALRRRVAPLS